MSTGSGTATCRNVLRLMLPKLALGFSPLSGLRLLKRIAAPPFPQTLPPIAPNQGTLSP